MKQKIDATNNLGPGEKDIQEVPVTLPEATTIATAVHGSLHLDAILRGCRRILRLRFPIGRLSLVQHRVNETTATVYSLEGEGDTPLIGPKVIALEESRLQKCIVGQKELTVRLTDSSEQDNTEREYLLRPGTLSIVYLPLMLGEKLKGVLALELPVADPLISAQKSYLTYLADHVALAIENSDGYYMERRRARLLSMLSAIAKQAATVDESGEFLRSVAALLREGLDYLAVQIWILGSKQDRLNLAGNALKPPLEEVPNFLPPAMVEECRRQNRILCNNNTLAQSTPPPSHQGTASQLCVPIRLRNKFIGVLSVESNRLDAFPAEDLNIMEGVSSLIASAFDTLRVFEQSQLSNQYMQAILESARDLAIVSTDINGYVITSSAGSQRVFNLSQQELQGRDVLSLFANPSFQREMALYISKQNISVLQRNRVIQRNGEKELFLDVIVQRTYDPQQHPIGFLCIARDVTENVLLHRTLESLSITDELTGLYNQRRYFTSLNEEIVRSRRFRKKFSLCFFDLDGFKKYNDTYGHLKGDEVLRHTAKLIIGQVRVNIDTCYRYGGDEFIILMPETTIPNAQTVAERIRVQLHELFNQQIAASIGIAEFSDNLDANTLTQKADQAMYEAKQRGGNRIVLASQASG